MTYAFSTAWSPGLAPGGPESTAWLRPAALDWDPLPLCPWRSRRHHWVCKMGMIPSTSESCLREKWNEGQKSLALCLKHAQEYRSSQFLFLEAPPSSRDAPSPAGSRDRPSSSFLPPSTWWRLCLGVWMAVRSLPPQLSMLGFSPVWLHAFEPDSWKTASKLQLWADSTWRPGGHSPAGLGDGEVRAKQQDGHPDGLSSNPSGTQDFLTWYLLGFTKFPLPPATF